MVSRALRIVVFVLGAALCLTATCGPARAAEPVDAATVCEVQRALKWARPAWPEKRCREVAAALSVLSEPLTMLAVAANESGMNEKAYRKARPHVVDIGLTGLRCVLDERGRCVNSPVRGRTIAELMESVRNIQLAHVLATAKGPRWLDRWNGSPGYAARIGVLAAAIRGEKKPTGKGAKWKRIRELVERVFKHKTERTS